MAQDVPAEVALADKVAFLGAVESHASERPGSVAALETHLSWVFLTERFAYKLKKPVRHPLSDLRSLEARRQNCLVEVRLNRRLAPDVYLGTRALTLAAEGGGLRLGGAGPAVDWLVAMRRLPDELMLDRALRSGGPERDDLDRIALTLAQFYQGLAPQPIAPDSRRRWYRREIELSWKQLGRAEFALDHDADRADRRAPERFSAGLARPPDRASPGGADRGGARRSAARAHLPGARAGDHRLPRVQSEAASRRPRGRDGVPGPGVRRTGSGGCGRAAAAQLRDADRRPPAGSAGRLVRGLSRTAAGAPAGCPQPRARAALPGRPGSPARIDIST